MLKHSSEYDQGHNLVWQKDAMVIFTNVNKQENIKH